MTSLDGMKNIFKTGLVLSDNGTVCSKDMVHILAQLGMDSDKASVLVGQIENEGNVACDAFLEMVWAGAQERRCTADDFAGGHAECRAKMENRAEFAKTHDDPERLKQAEAFFRFASSNELWSGIVPKFIGLKTIDDRKFLVLENIVGVLDQPVVADFKLGTKSWAPGASPEKIAKMVERDAATTTPLLGFRVVSGMLPQGAAPADGYESAGRVAVKKGLDQSHLRAGESVDSVNHILERFFSTASLREAFLEKLKPFIHVFEQQTEHAFTGSSLLVCYDHCDGAPSLNMRLIDFGHAQGGQTTIDEGVLKGLQSLRDLVMKIA